MRLWELVRSERESLRRLDRRIYVVTVRSMTVLTQRKRERSRLQTVSASEQASTDDNCSARTLANTATHHGRIWNFKKREGVSVWPNWSNLGRLETHEQR